MSEPTSEHTRFISKSNNLLSFIRELANRLGKSRKFAYILAIAAVASGAATVITLTSSSQSTLDIQRVINLLYLDGILLLLIGGIVTRRLVLVWLERRRGAAGSGLHIRLVALFSLVAVTPAILVAIFSSLFLNFGIQAWFSERVSTALNESLGVSKAYLLETRKNISTDAFAIANDLNVNAAFLLRNRWNMEQKLTSHAALRSLAEVVLLDSNSTVIARSQIQLTFDPLKVSSDVFSKANSGQVSIIGTNLDNSVKALIKLNRYVDTYLLVERFVDTRVTNHIERVNLAVAEYNSMEKQRGGIQISFVIVFIVVALLLLLAAVWIGLTVSTQLAEPISSLIGAAEDVSEGDLTVRVNSAEAVDEFLWLINAFNKMTEQLESQQAGLIEANRELDERRRFTETVLSGVSAGIIGLDNKGNIHLPNRSASDLTNLNLNTMIGQNLTDAIPEMGELLTESMQRPDRLCQSEISLIKNGKLRTFLVRIAGERLAGEIIGYVVTFDDITQLLSAQRTAAWADVARRIAHEIKNPLTPIQLSAERLKRKYLSQITKDTDIFVTCTDTIIRQVEDIGKMVDEFSNFARMPQPSIKFENLSKICRDSIFVEKNRTPSINFNNQLPDKDFQIHCDSRQISRVLTNLLKNAAESIEVFHHEKETGEITLSLETSIGQEGEPVVKLSISDNGNGLPEDQLDRLAEPYVTTRAKGTGLGLAIVKKIMEDHKGELLLENTKDGGAHITLVFFPDELSELSQIMTQEEPLDPMKVMVSLTTLNSE